MKKKPPHTSTFKDSDFAGVDPTKRQALVTALNSLSEQVRQAGEALHDTAPDDQTAVPPPETVETPPNATPP